MGGKDLWFWSQLSHSCHSSPEAETVEVEGLVMKSMERSAL